MNLKNPARYDTFSRLLHWLSALAVTIAFVLGPGGFGRQMHQGLDPATRWDIVWHESLGLLVFALTAVRLLWLLVRPQAPRFDMPASMQLAAKLAHLGLWALLLALPLTALLGLGGEGHPLTLVGGYRLEQIPVLGQWPLARRLDWGELHGWLGDALIWLAGLHAVAAIYHHVHLKDGVLRSMLSR